MAETIGYRAYHQPDSIAPPIPYKKPRPAAFLNMNSPRYVPPQQHPPLPSPHTHYTAYEQYGSDRLHPNHTHRREAQGPLGGSFPTYQPQRNLPSINTNVNSFELGRHPGSASSVSPQRHYSVSTNYQVEPYVATLRKQKATVWCERAQTEDPRIVAAQRAAKTRATMEVTGSSSYLQDMNSHGFGGSSSDSPASSLYGGTSGHGATPSLTLASTKPSKILAAAGVGGGVHTVRKKTWVKDRAGGSHGSGKKIIMDPGSLIVGAVPTRLSASEVMGDSSDEEGDTGTRRSRRGTRSSINSTHRQSTREYERSRRSSEGLRHTNSTGSKSSAGSSAYSAPRSIAEEEEEEEKPATTVYTVTNPGKSSPRYLSRNGSSGGMTEGHRPIDYFANPPPTSRRATTSTVGSSWSATDGLGPLPSGLAVEKVRTPGSELRRSGSVDEREARTRTMSGVRLFVANPDAN